MLAANLASQIQDTAAVLLFASGGGMKPREEVKWTIYHRMEKHGVLQDEIEQYMNFLDKQMDIMMFDPTPEKQFLGNTYKWWASFLTAEEVAKPLNQQSLPVCLIHGVEDNKIPIRSADLAAEVLKESNAFTYLRLEGYGHDLDSAEIHEIVCLWLASILSGQESLNDTFIVRADISKPTLLENSRTDVSSDYVFSRGKDRDNGDKGGKVNGSIGGSKDSDGNESLSGDIKGSYDFGNGFKGGASVGGSYGQDSDGNARKEAHGKLEGSYDF